MRDNATTFLAIGEILKLKLNQEEKPPKQDIIKLHPEAKVF
jgi:hypothetical protein